MTVRPRGRALQEPELQQIRLVDVLDRLGLLAERDGERREPDRAAAEPLDHAAQELAVEALEPDRVDLEQRQRLLGDRGRDDSLVTHLGDVAHAAQDAVRDPRRAARAARDELCRVVGDLDAEDAGRAAHDRRELDRAVVVEPEREAEAVAQRRRQQPGARRRADQGERRQVERQRARSRALPDDDVEPEVLERRIEDLLRRAVEAVDLVDEEDVARLERGQDRGDVALPLERRPGDLPDADTELVAHDLRERRLAEPGRPGEQDVVERLAARLRRVERDLQLLLDPLLPDEVGERARPQRPLDLLLGVAEHRRQELRHAAFLSTRRTCSSIEQLRVDLRERALGVDQRPAELDQRVARGQVAASARARRRRAASFSFSSSTTRCAVLSPIPGIAWNRFTSSRAIALRSSAGVEPLDDRERDLRADAGDAEQQLEELALLGGREAVELRARPRGRPCGSRS